MARVYGTLSSEERSEACVGADNYREAGAIDFFGPQVQPAQCDQRTSELLLLRAAQLLR